MIPSPKWVLPSAIIFMVDAYIVFMLWTVAGAAQGKKEWRSRLPHHTTSLAVIPMLAVALISAFAGLYIGTSAVKAGEQTLRTITDGVYFSIVTMTTLGYGDFVPQSPLAKYIVVLELASGFLLLVAAVPLVISRLSSFADDEPKAQTREVMFETLRIVLPGGDGDQLSMIGNTLTWQRFSFHLTVTKSLDETYSYRWNGAGDVSIQADKKLVIDSNGAISQI